MAKIARGRKAAAEVEALRAEVERLKTENARLRKQLAPSK